MNRIVGMRPEFQTDIHMETMQYRIKVGINV